jgi:hypothetical protein
MLTADSLDSAITYLRALAEAGVEGNHAPSRVG